MYPSVLEQAAVTEQAAFEIENIRQLHSVDLDMGPVRYHHLVHPPILTAERNLRVRWQVHAERREARVDRGQGELLDRRGRAGESQDGPRRQLQAVERTP